MLTLPLAPSFARGDAVRARLLLVLRARVARRQARMPALPTEDHSPERAVLARLHLTLSDANTQSATDDNLDPAELLFKIADQHDEFSFKANLLV